VLAELVLHGFSWKAGSSVQSTTWQRSLASRIHAGILGHSIAHHLTRAVERVAGGLVSNLLDMQVCSAMFALGSDPAAKAEAPAADVVVDADGVLHSPKGENTVPGLPRQPAAHRPVRVAHIYCP